MDPYTHQLRLECLRLAASHDDHPCDVVKRADTYFRFLTASQTPRDMIDAVLDAAGITRSAAA